MDHIVSYYDQIAKGYDDSRFNNSYGKFIDHQERRVLGFLLQRPHEVVLDMACGSGRFLDLATCGIDASPEMVSLSQAKFPSKPVFIADAAQLPFEDDSIDTIIAFHFFMHMSPDKTESILRECNRVLKKDGRIIFDVPSKKRRRLIGYKPGNWHGSQSYTLREIAQLHKDLRIHRTFGIMLLPIHRLSDNWRKHLVNLDFWLGNSVLKEYSSYLIVEACKR